MKEHELPASSTFSISLKVEDLHKPDFCQEIMNENMLEEMAIARRNAGHVVFATISIEKKIDQIICLYFTEGRVNRQRHLFEEKFLRSSILNFNAKKNLLSDILNEEELLSDKKKKSAVAKALKEVMIMRNSFAHEEITHKAGEGCQLKIIGAKPRTQTLNDEFFEELTEMYTTLESYLDEAMDALRKIYGPYAKIYQQMNTKE